ncbi:hypothetical protein FRC20_006180 [Serendipita sp. 405]|nr:hypothetical protein FRC20_006180 [Serendipita sp. 405]
MTVYYSQEEDRVPFLGLPLWRVCVAQTSTFERGDQGAGKLKHCLLSTHKFRNRSFRDTVSHPATTLSHSTSVFAMASVWRWNLAVYITTKLSFEPKPSNRRLSETQAVTEFLVACWELEAERCQGFRLER